MWFLCNDTEESSIGANGFNYGRNEGEMTPDAAKDLANAIAKNTTGENILRAQIDVTVWDNVIHNLDPNNGQELSVKVTLFNSKADKGTTQTTTQTKKIVKRAVKTGDLSNVLL